MAATLKDATAIVGIGQTPFAKQLPAIREGPWPAGRSSPPWTTRASHPPRSTRFASYTMEETDEVEIAKAIGAGDVTFFSKVGYGGGRFLRHRRPPRRRDRHRPGHASASPGAPANAARGPRPVEEHRGPAAHARASGPGPSDCCGPPTRSACWPAATCTSTAPPATTSSTSPCACRNRANQNPAAMMYERPLTREMYMTARWISEPLCLFDNCLETDGALACVVVSAERARDCRQHARLRPLRRPGPARPAPRHGQLLERRPADRPRLDGRPAPVEAAPTSARRTSTWPRSTTRSPR